MAMDWVPQVDYGADTSNVGANITLVLMSPDAGQDVEGKVEDTDDLFVHRIVGDVFFTCVNATQGMQLMIGIMPLQFNVETFSPQLPWDDLASFWGAALAENANLRYWGLRTYELASTGLTNANAAAGGNNASIPWHWHWDLKPRQKIGSRLNLWPTLVFSFTDPECSFRVNSRLRLLVSGR